MNESPLFSWVSGPMPAGVAEVLARLRRTEGVAHIAVMPDAHMASEFCVGTVVASEQFVFPNAVGGDIGCGMLALKFDCDAEILADARKAAQILGALCDVCPGRRHHRAAAYGMPPEIRDRSLSHPHLESVKNSRDATMQLGTLGAGNHFLELQRDDQTHALWLMLHTGSRHLGQVILRHHLPKARRLSTQIIALEADSSEGRAYLGDVEIARAWARENRRLLALRAAEALEAILHASPLLDTLYDCDHNHVQLEKHWLDGRDTALFVHRKGATAAHKDQFGLIPGSMGTRSFHTMGRGHPDALASSSHGAGRTLSRTEARKRVSRSALRQQLRNVFYDRRLEPRLIEDAPAAYKDIDRVMGLQKDLTTGVRRLAPVLIHKAI